MKIQKTFEVKAPIEKVWAFITDPGKVAQCLPGCEDVQEIGPNTYKAVVKVRVGPIKTSFNTRIVCLEQRAPEFASYETSGEEGGKASRLKAKSTLALVAVSESKTSVTYESDINLVGRLGKFGSGMMQKVADSIGEEFVAELSRIVEGRTTVPSRKMSESTKQVIWIIVVGVIVLAALAFAIF